MQIGIRDGEVVWTVEGMRAHDVPESLIDFCLQLQNERERALREAGLLRAQLADRQRMAAV
jgi:hypothetical protein